MKYKRRALILAFRKLELEYNAYSNRCQFKYFISILVGGGVRNLGKHVYIILECSLKNLSLKLSLEHFKKLVSLPHLMLYVFLSIFDYYRLLSIAIVLKYYFHYHYHYRSKSHYRTSLQDIYVRQLRKEDYTRLLLSLLKNDRNISISPRQGS